MLYIRRHPHLPTACLAALLTTALFISTAHAEADSAVLQCKARPAAKQKARKIAGSLFARGEKAFSEKNYSKALKRFLCSLHMVEHEATVTNIEEIVKQMENKAHAAALLDEYISMNPDGELTETIRALASTLVEKETAPEPPPPPPPPPPPKEICFSVPDTKPIWAETDRRQRLLTVFGAATVGTGGALLVLGAVFQGLSAAQSDSTTSAQFQTGAIVGFAAGAVTAGIGAAELVLALKGKKRLQQLKDAPPTEEQCRTQARASAVPQILPGPGTMRLSWQF